MTTWRIMVVLVAACGGGSGSAPNVDGPGADDDARSPDAIFDAPTSADGVVASGYSPRNIGVDETHVYWTNWLGGGVFRAAHLGDTIETLVPDAQGSSNGIAVTADHVYYGGPCEGTTGICRMPKAGGTPELVDGGNGQGLHAFEGKPYWPSSDGTHTIDEAGNAVDVHVQDETLTQFGVVGTHLYFRDGTSGIARVTIGTPDSLVGFAKGPNPLGLKSDGEYLYWFDIVSTPNGPRTSIRRKRLDAPVAATVNEATPGDEVAAVDDVLRPWAFEVDAAHVYFVQQDATAVMRVSKAGGTPSLVADQWPEDIAQTEQLLFTSVPGSCSAGGCDGKIHRFAK